MDCQTCGALFCMCLSNKISGSNSLERCRFPGSERIWRVFTDSCCWELFTEQWLAGVQEPGYPLHNASRQGTLSWDLCSWCTGKPPSACASTADPFPPVLHIVWTRTQPFLRLSSSLFSFKGWFFRGERACVPERVCVCVRVYAYACAHALVCVCAHRRVRAFVRFTAEMPESESARLVGTSVPPDGDPTLAWV